MYKEYCANFGKKNKQKRDVKSPMAALLLMQSEENRQGDSDKKKKKKKKGKDEEEVDLVDPIVFLHANERQRWEESVKASVQFGIPIVKINRETCAKAEREKIEEGLHLLEKTKDPTLIEEVIVRYINNYTGLRDQENTHWILQKRYFSLEDFEALQRKIENIILNCNDKEVQREMFETLHQTLYDEDKLHSPFNIKYLTQYDDYTFDRLSDLEGKLQR